MGFVVVLMVLVFVVELLTVSPGYPHPRFRMLSSPAMLFCTSLVCLLHCKWSLECNSLSQMCQISSIKKYAILPQLLLLSVTTDQRFQPFISKNWSNPNTPPSYIAWSRYDKHETEGSVRAIWTLVCRRKSQGSLSPAQGHCQQEAVPTLHHVVCL